MRPLNVPTPAPFQAVIEPGPEYEPFPFEATESSVPAIFEAVARRYPERLAVKGGPQELTYAQLDRAANRLAHAILARLGAQNEPVALLVEHSPWAIIAILGALKAGKIYLPLDPAYPAKRTAGMLADAQAGLLVATRSHREAAAHLAGETLPVIEVDDLPAVLSQESPGLDIPPQAGFNLMYTSGSTGQPKGVLQVHRNVLHLAWQANELQKNARDDRFSLIIPVTFGASAADIFCPLLTGAALVMFDVRQNGVHRLAGWLREEGITIYHSVPTVFRQLLNTLDQPGSLPRLRLVKLGGEAVIPRDVELFQKLFSEGAVLQHSLATTETYLSACWLIDRQMEVTSTPVPVGYPTTGTEIEILDESGSPVAPGETGRIAIRSRYLSPGYWRKPELTRSAFLSDPQGGDQRTYISGDLGRWNEAGLLEHLGRVDDMVKLHGQRVELSEIEAALLEVEGVREAACALRPGPGGEARLAAYLVAGDPPPPSTGVLRSRLAKLLPAHMVPAAFVTVERLPQLPFGKVNRAALPAPDWGERAGSGGDSVPPATPTQAALADLFAEVLGLQADGARPLDGVRPPVGARPLVGVHDSFFELGGSSLDAARLAVRLRETLGVDLPLEALFEAPTVAGLEACLAARSGITPGESEPPTDLERALRLLGEA